MILTVKMNCLPGGFPFYGLSVFATYQGEVTDQGAEIKPVTLQFFFCVKSDYEP